MNSCKEYGLPTPKIEEQNDFLDIEIVRSQDNLQTIKSKIRPITADYGRLFRKNFSMTLFTKPTPNR